MMAQGKIKVVGARGVVHTPQFNGKQEGYAKHGVPNLRCPRNGKWTRRKTPLLSQPLNA
jgi:hypothetical protein